MTEVPLIEFAILVAQTIAVAFLAGWMFTGVRDNILYPSTNRASVEDVLTLRRIEELYPDDYALIKHRRLTSRATRGFAFKSIVAVEFIAALTLSLATIGLAAATLGLIDAETARAAAILATVIFSCIWGGMLVVGNHFAYWLGHEGTQVTHFFLVGWGLLTIVLLCQG